MSISRAKLEKLLSQLDTRLRRQFLEMVASAKSEQLLRELEEFLEQGNLTGALQSIARETEAYANSLTSAFQLSAIKTAEAISKSIGVTVSFDATNIRAVRKMSENRLEFIREFTGKQLGATREALTQGLLEGTNPRQTARAFRDSIGLTQRQVQAVNTYRRLLEDGDPSALTRGLRDRRFDRTVRRALRDDVPLTRKQINRMVTRYRQRYLKFRAETIARTESLRTLHEGMEEMYQQAFDSGDLDPATLVRQWNTARSRVRETHQPMDKQKRPVGVPFISGGGILLRYPGDPSAPASEVIQCRCVVSTRVAKPA